MLIYMHGKEVDARTFSQDAQYQIRRQVVKLRKRGMPYAEIAEVVGVSLSYACRVYKRYEREGMPGISKGQRRSQDRAAADAWYRARGGSSKTMQDRTPDQLKMPFALWTRQAVQELIKRQHG